MKARLCLQQIFALDLGYLMVPLHAQLRTESLKLYYRLILDSYLGTLSRRLVVHAMFGDETLSTHGLLRK
ncbi:hypothetical protein BRARA_A01979 [Brassica rapa]|uniref:Uncharacterized protein n=1 Tax=Brassica campestris TaxID=3711 RepID=A0A398AUG1_BRACM|nr:hypothetical protein BRARA_A01979 [Brassica rapa]